MPKNSDRKSKSPAFSIKCGALVRKAKKCQLPSTNTCRVIAKNELTSPPFQAG